MGSKLTRFKLWSVLALALALAVLAVAPSTDLVGIVVTSENQPIEGCAISTRSVIPGLPSRGDDSAVVSDAEGRFSLDSVAPVSRVEAVCSTPDGVSRRGFLSEKATASTLPFRQGQVILTVP
jgi:hypothetical protein